MTHDAYTRSVVGPKRTFRAAAARLGYVVRRTPRSLIAHPDSILHPTIPMLLDHLQAVSSPVTFIEVGAYDGIQGDPLWGHVTTYGWRGVVVEPQEAMFRRLKENYAPYPKVLPLQCAVGPERGRTVLYKATPDSNDPADWRGQQASLSREQVMRLKSTIPELADNVPTESVEMLTIADVLECGDMPRVDLVSIDTEGMDLMVLKSIDFSSVKPKVILFEHKHLTWADRETAVEHLVRAGYRVGTVSSRDTAAVAADLISDG